MISYFEKNKSSLILFGYILIFLFSFIIPVLIRYKHYCYNNWDLGIYSQAISLLEISNLNPKLSVLPFRIFNDHFDPIIIFPAIFAKFFDPPLVLIFTEFIFIILSSICLLYIYQKNIINFSIFLFSITYLFFSRGTIHAIQYPSHPTTWSIFAIILVFIAIHYYKKTWIVFSLLFLFSFKEEFPFVGIMLSVWLYFKKNDRLFALNIFFVSLMWIIFVFFLRYHLDLFSGPINKHFLIIKMFPTFFSDPLFIFNRLSYDKIRFILEIILPVVPLFVFFYLKRIPLNILALLLILPLLGIRILGSSWGFQYGAPLCAFLVFFFLPLGSKNKITSISKSYLVLSILLIFITNIGTFYHSYNTYTGPSCGYNKDNCNKNQKRLKSLNKARDYLSDHSKGAVLAQGNLVPSLLTDKRDNVFPIVGNRVRIKPLEGYKYIFIEKKLGDAYPVSRDFILMIYHKIINIKNTKILIDDEYVFLAEGEYNDQQLF